MIELDSESQQNLSELAELIIAGKRLLFITGAGLSVSSGIRPYRSGANAIWSNYLVENGQRSSFRADPSAWWNEFWLRTHETPEFIYAKPNAGHIAIASMVKFAQANVITQNIDGLHLKSGISDEHLVECHGRLGRYKCINDDAKCPYAYEKCIYIDDINEFAQGMTSMDCDNLLITPPRCPHCKDPIMPQTLLFDENYNSHKYFKWEYVLKWVREAEVIIYVGTSFSVGITNEAHYAAKSTKAREFNFNLYPDSINGDKIPTIVGKSEKTLPMLQELIMNLRSTSICITPTKRPINLKALKALR